jgi:hypothetical protein
VQQLNFVLKTVGRACNGCTKCCDGWLTGKAYGLHFYPGCPCHFKTSKGCMIYLTRPKDPCVSFECEWKRNLSIPEWIKPNLSNVIIVQRFIETIPYLGVNQAGTADLVKITQWLSLFSDKAQKNIVFWSNSTNRIYSKDLEFVKLIKQKFSSVTFTLEV